MFLGTELKGQFTYGETIIDYRNKLGKKKNALVLNEIDREEFVKLIKNSLKKLKK